MKISSAADGARVRLGGPEADTLASLVADLVTALQPDGLAAEDPVYRRLFPHGYRDNPDASEAFRELTEDSLRSERLARAEQCLAELAGAASRGKLDITLDAGACERWLRVLNDMRLAIGTRLDITEDDETGFDVGPDHPEAMPRAIYAYLTGVQDALVRARMG